MATSTLNVTTTLNGSQYVVTASLAPGGLLPPNIFIYTNLGTTDLGDYIGVAALSELTRLQPFTGVAIPVFGNSFVLYSSATTTLPPGVSSSALVATLVSEVQALSTAYQNAKISTQQFTIT